MKPPRACLAMVLAGGTLLAGTAGAAGPVLELSSEIEAGWTSNAVRGPEGAADRYLLHSETLAVGFDDGPLALRGTIAFSETRFARHWPLEGKEAAAGLSALWRAGPETMLRGGFRLGYTEEGDMLDLGIAQIAVVRPAWRSEAEIVFDHHSGATEIALGLLAETVRNGDSRFPGVALPPERLAADNGFVAVSGILRQHLDDHVALTGGIRYTALDVSAADVAHYGRLPAQSLRLAAGAALTLPLRGRLEIEAGADLLFLDARAARGWLHPFGRVAVDVIASERFTLAMEGQAGLDLIDPGDGAARWLAQARTSARYRLTPVLTLGAAVSAQEEWSVLLGRAIDRQWGAEFVLDAEIGVGLHLGARLGHFRRSGELRAFSETRSALTLKARL